MINFINYLIDKTIEKDESNAQFRDFKKAPKFDDV